MFLFPLMDFGCEKCCRNVLGDAFWTHYRKIKYLQFEIGVVLKRRNFNKQLPPYSTTCLNISAGPPWVLTLVMPVFPAPSNLLQVVLSDTCLGDPHVTLLHTQGRRISVQRSPCISLPLGLCSSPCPHDNTQPAL